MKIEKQNKLNKETKKRVNKMKKEFSKKLLLKVFENTENYNQIIAQVQIPFSALCEHHHIAFTGEAHLGYIPGKYLIGLSKLGRIVEKYLNPTVKTIQEKATQQIMNELIKIKPQGAIVIVKAQHYCICFRGVKKPSWTITSSVYGLFSKQSSLEEKFINLLKI